MHAGADADTRLQVVAGDVTDPQSLTGALKGAGGGEGYCKTRTTGCLIEAYEPVDSTACVGGEVSG